MLLAIGQTLETAGDGLELGIGKLEALLLGKGDDFLDELRDARRVCRLVPGSEILGAKECGELRAGKGDTVFRRAPARLVDELADYWFATRGFVPEREQVLAGVQGERAAAEVQVHACALTKHRANRSLIKGGASDERPLAQGVDGLVEVKRRFARGGGIAHDERAQQRVRLAGIKVCEGGVQRRATLAHVMDERGELRRCLWGAPSYRVLGHEALLPLFFARRWRAARRQCVRQAISTPTLV